MISLVGFDLLHKILRVTLVKEIIEAADIALCGIDEVFHAITKIPIEPTIRNALAVTLMRASIDHARAVALLVRTHPDDFGASAVALHRAQVEALYRGAFFAGAATDEEVAFFTEHDEMPGRTGPDGKKKGLNPRGLAPLIGDVLSVGENKKLISFIDKSWDALCGMVHGGMHVVNNYHNAQIGFKLPGKDLVDVIGNALALAQLAMIGISKTSLADDAVLSEIFRAPYQAQKDFHEFKIKLFP